MAAYEMVVEWPHEGNALKGIHVIYDWARGGDVPMKLLGNGCYAVLGFAASKALPEPVLSFDVPEARGLLPLDPEAFKAQVRSMLAAHMAPAFGGGLILKSLPWGKFIPLVVQALEIVLASQFPKSAA